MPESLPVLWWVPTFPSIPWPTNFLHTEPLIMQKVCKILEKVSWILEGVCRLLEVVHRILRVVL